MNTWVWCIPGLILPLTFPALPGKGLFVVLALLILLAAYKKAFPFLFFLLGLTWSCWFLQDRLDQRLDIAPPEPVQFTGVVTSQPVVRGDMLEFRFYTEGRQLLIRWYRDFPDVLAGEKWQLYVRLKAARSRVNFYGPDRERWYFAQGISALGQVQTEGSFLLAPPQYWDPERLRASTRHSVAAILEEHPSRPLVLALALADRSEVTPEAWARFRRTGTSHLLAISGMHVGLAAILGFWLGRLFTVFLPLKPALIYGHRIAWATSLGIAGFYSMLAGMGTSTRRALIMISVVALISLLRRNTAPWLGLLLAMLVVLCLDPLAPLGAGFWFSFFAVFLLFAIFIPRPRPGSRIKTIVTAQAGLSILMLPLGMFWFQQVTFLGLVSNLVAIPWVSFGAVPAILLGVLTMPSDSWVSAFLLFSAAESLFWLESFLEWLEHFGQNTWIATRQPEWFSVLLASTGMLLLLLPRIALVRWVGLLCFLPLILPPRPEKGHLQVDVLDIGQGLAVILETDRHLLLYDTGPGDGSSWSLAPSVLVPSIANRVRDQPDLIMVSHGDLDHSGGLFELEKHYPEAPVQASFRNPTPGVLACLTPHSWSWDGVAFEVLHPRPGLPYLGNDSSCVLSVKFGGQSMLLTGDISTAVEQRLIFEGLKQHQILFAPHHGSKSSSGMELINQVNPEIALVSSGYENPFDFPHPDVRKRYLQNGTHLINTADCGGIRITITDDGIRKPSSARRAQPRLWRWLPNEQCP
jgi:competence protein ComEC